MISRESFIRIVLSGFSLALLAVYVFPLLGNKLNLFTAAILFISTQLIIHGLARFLVEGTKGMLIVTLLAAIAIWFTLMMLM